MNWIYWAIISAALAGATNVLLKPGLKHIEADIANVIRTAVILACFGVVVMLRTEPWPSIEGKAWALLLGSGVAAAGSWYCFTRAMKGSDVSLVTNIDKLSVPIAMLLAALFLGERLTSWHWLGAGLMIGGSLMLIKN